MVDVEVVGVRVGALTFRTRVAGPEAGDVVILLHGYPQTSWEWRAQIAALAYAGFRAVAPDQRGYSPGARPGSVDDYTQDALVSDVLGIADACGATRFHLVGHDWGAMLAWHVAVWHPERLRSLTIVSVPHPAALARALHDPSSDQADRFFYIPMFKDHREGELFGSGDQMRAIFDASGLRGHDVDEHVEVLSEPGALETATHWYRAFDYDAGDLGPVVDVPTLFVWSTDDPALGPDAARWTRDHVRGPYRFEVFEGAPHWIPEAQPDRLSALLLEHIAST